MAGLKDSAKSRQWVLTLVTGFGEFVDYRGVMPRLFGRLRGLAMMALELG